MSIRTFTTVYRQEGDWWIGWVEEMPGPLHKSGPLRKRAKAYAT